MEMQSHEVSGGNAESPDASSTRPLRQSTPAQGSIIHPHGSEGKLVLNPKQRMQPAPRATACLGYPVRGHGGGVGRVAAAT